MTVLVTVSVGMPPPAVPLEAQAASSPAATAQKAMPRVDLYGDPLPERAVARLGTLRLPDASEVQTRDGRIAVLRDNRVAWLDPATRREVGRLSGPPDVAPESFTVSPDGRRVIYQARDGLWGWDVATDRQVFHIARSDQYLIGERVQFSPDGRRFVWITHSGNQRHRTHLGDATTGKEL
jgi:hypothetical protein